MGCAGLAAQPHCRLLFAEVLDMIDYYGEHRGDIDMHLTALWSRSTIWPAAFLGATFACAALGHRLQVPARGSIPSCLTSPCRWGAPPG